MGKSKVYVLFQIMARVGYVEQKFNIISNATTTVENFKGIDHNVSYANCI